MGIGHGTPEGTVRFERASQPVPARSAGEDASPRGDTSEDNSAGTLTTAEVLLRGMRASSLSALPVGGFPLHLLIVEQDTHLRQTQMEIGRQLGFTAHGGDPADIASTLSALQCDVVLLDLSPETVKLDLLRQLRQAFPRVPVLVTTAFATVQVAVDALRQGANDFLTKPFSLEELTTALHMIAEQRSLDVELRRVQHHMRTSPAMQEVAAASPGMQKLLTMVTRVALSRHPVMVLGESGSGKERVARMLHGAAALGQDAAPPFLQCMCAGRDAAAVEAELFGAVQGGTTPERTGKDGLLTIDGGGTLFLDEIDSLSLELQARLLRALQDRSVRLPGSTTARPVTVRVLAASSRDLPALVDRGAFRKDLYFRLNVVTLRVPPLRQRREDIPLLAATFLEQHSRSRNLSYSLAPDAMRVLLQYEWPGNVRELEAVIARACSVSSGPELHVVDLPTQLQHGPAQADSLRIDRRMREPVAQVPVAAESGSVESIAEMERRVILSTLDRLNGDKLMTAKLLGIGKTTLYRKLKEYGVGELTT